MKKTNKIISGIFLILLMIAIANISKAASFGLSAAGASGKAGDTVNVTFTTTGASASNMLTSFEGNYSVSGSATASGGTVTGGSVNSNYVSTYSPSGTSSNVTVTVPVTISSTATGNVTITLSGTITDNDEKTDELGNIYFGTSSVSATATITVTGSSTVTPEAEEEENDTNTETGTTTLSSNAKLKSLSGNFTLTPSFSSTTYAYTTTVSDLQKLTLSFQEEEANATYSVSGNSNFEEGTNIVTITVTAPDGKTTQSYKITVTKLVSVVEDVIPNITEDEEELEEEIEEEEEEEEEEFEEVIEEIELGLKSLMISGVQLSPGFSKDIYEYNATYSGESDMLEVIASSTLDTAKIEITGNEDLQIGENIITIRVIDGSEELEYIVTLTRLEVEEVVEVSAEVENVSFFKTYAFEIGIAVLSISLVTLIGVLVRNMKNKSGENFSKEEDFVNEEDDEEDDEELEDSKVNMDDLLKAINESEENVAEKEEELDIKE